MKRSFRFSVHSGRLRRTNRLHHLPFSARNLSSEINMITVCFLLRTGASLIRSIRWLLGVAQSKSGHILSFGIFSASQKTISYFLSIAIQKPQSFDIVHKPAACASLRQYSPGRCRIFTYILRSHASRSQAPAQSVKCYCPEIASSHSCGSNHCFRCSGRERLRALGAEANPLSACVRSPGGASRARRSK
jgi:hypothetical protein